MTKSRTILEQSYKDIGGIVDEFKVAYYVSNLNKCSYPELLYRISGIKGSLTMISSMIEIALNLALDESKKEMDDGR